VSCDLKKTVLHDDHVRLGAEMAGFAGWEMPIHYGSILEETMYTRVSCSVFDTCHMGEFIIEGDPSSCRFDEAVTHPVSAMKEKSCAYGFLLNEQGGILDDLIVYRISRDRWMTVVNAANTRSDADAIRSRLSPSASFEDVSGATVKIDVQGPKSLEVMKQFTGDGVKALRYFGFSEFNMFGEDCVVSRTGYTGELGFEVYLSVRNGERFWRELCGHPLVKPAGLGARDILRLEAGLPLYGNELTAYMTPFDAGMDRFVDLNRNFYGKEALKEKSAHCMPRRLVALEADGRRIPRHGNKILSDGNECGVVTSGVYSPHLERGIGFGYVNSEAYEKGRPLTISSERGGFGACISEIPFVKNTSLRYRED
jgi:aminomethyltransferase